MADHTERESHVAAMPSRLPLVVACLVLALGFAPLVNWIPGGHEANWYAQTLAEWWSGGAIAVGGGVVLALVSRRVPIWREGLLTAAMAPVARHRRAFGLAVAGLAFTLYAVVAASVFTKRPLLIDELVQLMQARIFSQGRLYLPAPAYPEFFSALHIVDLGGKWYSQFPPGGPAMLLIGTLVNAGWLVGPACGAIAVAAFWALAQRLETNVSVAIAATLLFAFAPFGVFMSGSHMNHVPTLMWCVLAMVALLTLAESDRSRPALALALGLCLGVAASIRPVDAAAVAIPAAIWLLHRAWRSRATRRDVAAAGLGVAIPMAFILYYNVRTTGSATLFGYELLWGKSHGLGFHRAPWGMAHTPARGLELVNLYFLRLQSYFLETPLPSLLPAVGAMALSRRLSSGDRYLLAVSGLLVAGYFAYWHDGFYLGPRFFYLLLPLLAIWTARALPVLRSRYGPSSLGVRIAVFTMVIAAGIGASANIPLRVRQYRGGLASMRLDYTGPAARQGVHHAVILVRESWGTQLIARLWALGVPRSETELLYRSVDSCLLEEKVTRLERDAVRDTAAWRALTPLLVDSAHVVKSFLSLDRTERVLPGVAYSERCVRRLAEDKAGFTLLAPLHALDQRDNVYARDLHARDTLLLSGYPSRPLYLLRPVDDRIGSPLLLEPLKMDSLRLAWSREVAATQ